MLAIGTLGHGDGASWLKGEYFNSGQVAGSHILRRRRVMRSILALVLVMFSLSAKGQVFNDWEANTQSYGASAATMNDSGNLFGQLCFTEDQNCLWVLVVTESTCNQGSTYSALINASTGAVPVELTCEIYGGTHFLTFNSFDAIRDVVLKNERLGIAFPMKDGRFTVMRFSLVGANSAIQAASQIVLDADNESTRTQVL